MSNQINFATTVDRMLEKMSKKNKKNKHNKDKGYVYKGRRNKTILPELVSLCKMEQEELKTYLVNELSKYRKDIIVDDGFIFVPGDDVLLTAHMDTVHKEPVKTFFEEKKTDPETKKVTHHLTSPQGIGGDDRCGIYTIMEIVKEGKYNPAILFCEDEEIGGIGSEKFTKTDYIDQIVDLKFYVEIDRRGNDDAVFYDCGNQDFQKFICEVTGYEEDWGSFSDISHLSPVTDVASVNLSSGYYNEHTLTESICIEDMLNTIEKVNLLLEAAKTCERFDYQMVRYGRYNRLFGSNYDYDDWGGYNYYGNTYGSYYGTNYSNYSSGITGALSVPTSSNTKDKVGIEILYIERDGDKQYEGWQYVEEVNVSACFGVFFQAHPNICFNDILDWDYYGNYGGDNTESINEIELEKED